MVRHCRGTQVPHREGHHQRCRPPDWRLVIAITQTTDRSTSVAIQSKHVLRQCLSESLDTYLTARKELTTQNAALLQLSDPQLWV